jgi:hypothetical protein
MLDCHGSTRLTRRAAISMKFISLLLVINFFFDMGAWGLLFNALFSGGKGVFVFGLHTIFALFAATLISATIFIYEQAFMTADLDQPFSSTEIKNTRYRLRMPRGLRIFQRVVSKLVAPVILRFVVIIGAALITTQPVELMFFKGPIERRMHEESVRLESVVRHREYQDAKKKYHMEGMFSDVIKDKEAAIAERLNAERVVDALKSQRASAVSARDRAASQADYARRKIGAVPEEERDRWRRAYSAALQRKADQDQKVKDLESQIDDKQGVVAAKKESEQNAANQIKEQKDEAENEARLLNNWVADVRKTKPGMPPLSREGIGGQKWVFQDQSYDFFQQLRVLSDLRNARPARWPEGTTYQDRGLLVENSKREEKNAANGANGANTSDATAALIQEEIKKAEDEERLNAKIDEQFYTQAYWAIFGIAFVIPLLLLAFKLLQPQDLSDYYSNEAQRMYGNYDAILFAPPGEAAISQAAQYSPRFSPPEDAADLRVAPEDRRRQQEIRPQDYASEPLS